MNLHNLCNVGFISLSIHYAKFKDEYNKKGIFLYFDLLADSDDKYQNNAFGLQVVVRSKNTNNVESFVFTEEILKKMDEPGEKYIIPKIKQMICDVESKDFMTKYRKELKMEEIC